MNAPLTDLKTLVASDSRHTHILNQLERKLLWLSAWMIHNANNIRPNRDGLKVGGHQASCASCISILAALYFEIAGFITFVGFLGYIAWSFLIRPRREQARAARANLNPVDSHQVGKPPG